MAIEHVGPAPAVKKAAPALGVDTTPISALFLFSAIWTILSRSSYYICRCITSQSYSRPHVSHQHGSSHLPPLPPALYNR